MNTHAEKRESSRTSVHTLVINGLAIALVFASTMFINIRLPFAPNGGLIHLGNVPLFIFAILFGRKTGFAAGAFGMGLFDLISGWTAWAPFTFLICGPDWLRRRQYCRAKPFQQAVLAFGFLGFSPDNQDYRLLLCRGFAFWQLDSPPYLHSRQYTANCSGGGY